MKIFPVCSCWVATLLLLAGCASNPSEYGYKRPFDFTPTKKQVQQYRTGGFRAKYDGLVNTNKALAKEERNRILHDLLYLIDAAHGEFCRSTMTKKAWTDLGADFAILGLSGAGSVVGGAGTKAILAAIAGGTQGAQLAINKRLFRDQAIEALQAQMRAAMMKRKAEILKRMRKGVDDYPLSLGLSDIVEYYHDGTLTRAFQNLVTESKKQEEEADDRVSDVVRQPASEEQIDDMAFLTDQLKAISQMPDEKAVSRAKRLISAMGEDASGVVSKEAGLNQLRDLVEDLARVENRARIPAVRKLFEAVQ